jgi:hypothetical protein
MYTLGLILTMPDGRKATPHNGVVLVRDGTRSLGRSLLVRITPAT